MNEFTLQNNHWVHVAQYSYCMKMSLGMMLTAALQERGEQSFVLFNFAVSNHTHLELRMSCADTTAWRGGSAALSKCGVYQHHHYNSGTNLLFTGSLSAASTPCLPPLRGQVIELSSCAAWPPGQSLHKSPCQLSCSLAMTIRTPAGLQARNK